MDSSQFGTILQRLTETRSRRGVVVGLLGGGLGLLGFCQAEAKPHHHHHKHKHPGGSPPPSSPSTPIAAADATCVTTGARLSNTRLAQTFRALHSGQLTSATVFLTDNLAGVDLDVEIWSVNQANAPSAVLAGATIANVPETVFPGPPRRLTATFATPPMVVAGLRYALVVTGPRNDYSLEGSLVNDPCPDGIVFAAFSAGEAFIPVPAEDLHFETIVTA